MFKPIYLEQWTIETGRKPDYPDWARDYIDWLENRIKKNVNKFIEIDSIIRTGIKN